MRAVVLVLLLAHTLSGQSVQEGKDEKKRLSNERMELKKITQLETTTCYSISYRYNEIDSIAEQAFMHVAGLRELDLSHNALPGEVIRADVFRGAFSSDRYEPLGLLVLDLGYNKIQSIGAKSFEHLPDLLDLRLNNNPLLVIDGPTEMALSTPPKLEILNLGYTQLSDLPESLLISLTKLKDIYLNGNSFKFVPALSYLGSTLQKLNLNDIKIESLNSSSFTGLVHLEELNINGCTQLKEVLSATFAPCIRLNRLFLSSNPKLSLIAKDAFYSDPNIWPIQEIHFHNDSLSTLENETIQWRRLQVLDLQDNPWNCNCQLAWMALELIPRLAKTDPERVVDIKCFSPREKNNISLMNLAPDMNMSCSENKQGSYSYNGTFHPFILVLAIISLIVCIAAVLVFGRQHCEKHRFQLLSDVKYSRFDEEEELYSRN